MDMVPEQTESPIPMGREEAELGRRLLSLSSEGILRVDAADVITFANPRLGGMLGYAPGELVGRLLYDLLFAEDHGLTREKRAARQQGFSEQYEARLRRKDGAECWTIIHVSTVREGGVYAGTFGLFTDITARRRAEEALRRSEQDKRFALDAAGLGTFSCDWPFDKILWDETAAHHFFLPPEAAVDFDLFYTLLHPDDRERTRAAVDRAVSERAEYNVEYRTQAPDGRTRWINAVGRLTYDAEGTPVRFDGITADISARKEIALEAARSQERERRIATILQDALQPPPPGEVPGLTLMAYTKPALDEAAIGGDFYDVFALDKELYALVIGDVSGKGLAAAAQLATVRNMLRGILYQCRAAASAVSGLNTIVTAHDLLRGFVTLWVGLYDARTGEVVSVSCGHEPPLLRRASGGPVEMLPTTGPPLGVSENGVYEEARVMLRPGDTLLLYTDGLSEAGPSRLDMLGTEGVARLLEDQAAEPDVTSAAAQIVRAAQDFSGGLLRDDVCVLLLRRA